MYAKFTPSFPAICTFLSACLMATASLQAQTEFRNSQPVAIPDGATAPIPGQPYPSVIMVDGLKGIVSDLTVTLYGYRHNNPDAVDLLLVAPDGTAVTLLSDVGGSTDIHGIDLVLDDSAAAFLPDYVTFGPGTYRPTNMGAGADSWLPPAPATASASSLSACYGQDPNGDWQLYAVSDVDGALGSIGGGWSLQLQTVKGNKTTEVDGLRASYDETVPEVLLQWETEYEYNTRYFIIERSSGGSAWTDIDTVAAAGFSTAPLAYHFKDGASGEGQIQYRLRIVAKDGTSTQSNVVPVNTRTAAAFSLYPNPARDHVFVALESDNPQKVSVRLSDMQNVTALTQAGTISSAMPMRLELGGLRAGTYFLTLTVGGKQTTRQLRIEP